MSKKMIAAVAMKKKRSWMEGREGERPMVLSTIKGT